jgi:hypothetical protein
MSDQSNESNPEMPPRQGPEAAAQQKFTGGGNLVTMYQAQGAGSESFPVLQAFQEYIEAERKQARRRIMQLSISFAVIMGVVVIGFLAAGVYMMQSTTNRLFEVAMAKKEIVPAPAVVMPPQPVVPSATPVPTASPALEASIRQMSEVLAKMQAEASRKQTEVAFESKPQPVESSSNPELDALKEELQAMKEQSRKLEGQLSAMHKQDVVPIQPAPAAKPKVRYSVEDALAIARKTGAEKEASDKAAAEKIAQSKAKSAAEAEQARLAQIEAQKKAALELSAARATAEREAQAKRGVQEADTTRTTAVNLDKSSSAEFPVADKAPPITPQGVAVPEPLKDMVIVSVPLKTKKGDMVPWRIFVPQ